MGVAQELSQPGVVDVLAVPLSLSDKASLEHDALEPSQCVALDCDPELQSAGGACLVSQAGHGHMPWQVYALQAENIKALATGQGFLGCWDFGKAFQIWGPG